MICEYCGQEFKGEIFRIWGKIKRLNVCQRCFDERMQKVKKDRDEMKKHV
jgi:ribosome-binding protein aMBF1 (putative translation factor)